MTLPSIPFLQQSTLYRHMQYISLIAKFMGPTWGPSGADRTQVGPMLAPWTLLSVIVSILPYYHWIHFPQFYSMSICKLIRIYIVTPYHSIKCRFGDGINTTTFYLSFKIAYLTIKKVDQLRTVLTVRVDQVYYSGTLGFCQSPHLCL